MKRPGTLQEHQGQTYLCIEGGFNADSRSVTLLATSDDPHFPPAEGVRPISWLDQGDWYPVARKLGNELALQDERHHDELVYADEVIEHYLADTPPDPEVAWVLEGVTGYHGALQDILPQGLAVLVFEDLAAAAALLEQRRADGQASAGEELVPVTHLPGFLTHLAREGYAGALWRGSQPIFFCVDDESALQFLRLGEGAGEGGGLQMEILDAQDGWSPYEGAEEIGFLDNGDACDARLAQVLGEIPLLDWPEAGSFWSAGPARGQPGIITVEEDGLDYGLLFGDEAQANEWLEELDQPWMSWPVPDLIEWLGHEALVERGGLLNPGSHRARRAVVWGDGDRVVVDSFSGFWVHEGDGRFRRAGEEG